MISPDGEADDGIEKAGGACGAGWADGQVWQATQVEQVGQVGRRNRRRPGGCVMGS
jgi:hypothetical protein